MRGPSIASGVILNPNILRKSIVLIPLPLFLLENPLLAIILIIQGHLHGQNVNFRVT